MLALPALISAALLVFGARSAVAVNGSDSGNHAYTYTSGATSKMGGNAGVTLSSARYEYTGLGSAESTIDFAPDGKQLIYTPALSNDGVGYATSDDEGATWNAVYPTGKTQGRAQVCCSGLVIN